MNDFETFDARFTALPRHPPAQISWAGSEATRVTVPTGSLRLTAQSCDAACRDARTVVPHK